MKKILIIILCSLNIFTIQAQIEGIVFSTEKSLQKDGIAKLKMLKNGNTASVEILSDIGLVVKLYDSNHKKVNEVTTELRQQNIKMSRLRAVFEINKDIMVMVVTYVKMYPTLCRYIYDGSTGLLKSNEVIFELPIVPAFQTDVIMAADKPIGDFFVYKDPNSDYYAIALYNPYAKEANKQIEIVHVSPAHEQINRAFMTYSSAEFKKIMVGDVFVDGKESVILTSYFSNSISTTGKENGYYYISKLNVGSTIFTSKELAQTAPYGDWQFVDCRLVYNKVLANVKVSSRILVVDDKKQILNYFINQTLNPKTLELSEKFNVPMTKALEVYSSKVSSKSKYEGIVQNYIVDQKGNNLYLAQPVYISPLTRFFDVAMTSTTPKGTEIFGDIIVYGNFYAPFNTTSIYANAPKGQMSFTSMDEFYGGYVMLMAGKNSNYVLLNNTPENYDKPDNIARIGAWMKTPNYTSYVYTYDKDGKLTKEYIFGKPATEKQAKYGLFQTADYNPETGLFATHVVEFLNGKKVVSIAWMPFK